MRKKHSSQEHSLSTPCRYVSPDASVLRCLSESKFEVKYVPEWFPGGGFKTFARAGLELFSIAVDSPLEYVKESLRVSLRNSQLH